MRKQNVIVFSSFKSLACAKAVCSELNKTGCINAVNWRDYFKAVYPKEYEKEKFYPLFCFLTKRIPSFDFAIIIAGKDDMIARNNGERDKENGSEKYRMRDNIIFELGMCCMALGETRVILLHQKGVKLFADLRGNKTDLRKDCNNHNPKLTVDNIQLTAFSYEFKKHITSTVSDITSYIKEKADDYDPVVVGAACSTASGYNGNFVMSALFAFNLYFTPQPTKKAMLNIPGGMEQFNSLCKSVKDLEFHILLPTQEAYQRHPEILAAPKQACEVLLYKNKKFNLLADCTISDSSRSIGFVCKYSQSRKKFIIIDIPTTLLSSYDTAQNILQINDDSNNKSFEEQRYVTKEIGMFKATLQKFWEMKHPAADCIVEEISFDDEIDRKNLNWLYE